MLEPIYFWRSRPRLIIFWNSQGLSPEQTTDLPYSVFCLGQVSLKTIIIIMHWFTFSSATISVNKECSQHNLFHSTSWFSVMKVSEIWKKGKCSQCTYRDKLATGTWIRITSHQWYRLPLTETKSYKLKKYMTQKFSSLHLEADLNSSFSCHMHHP